jgi:2'-5' RNA ligase
LPDLRLFLAVEPDESARRALAGAVDRLRRRMAAASDGVRWVEAAELHITLVFVGDTPAAGVPRLVEALGAAVPVAPYDLSLTRAGLFESRGRVRTLWLSAGAGAQETVAVQGILAERLRRAGWPAEGRPFVPHLTIGRVRRRAVLRTDALAGTLDSFTMPPIGWGVRDVALLASDLSGPRPAYTVVHRVRLEAGQSGPREPDATAAR